MNEHDELMEEGNKCKKIHMAASSHNAFKLRMSVLVNGTKFIGKADTGSDVSIINKTGLERKLKNWLILGVRTTYTYSFKKVAKSLT